MSLGSTTSFAPAAVAAGALLLLLLLVAPAGADGTAAPPEDTAGTIDVPPFTPLSEEDPARVRAWCDRAVAAGRARAGTQAGGDWILSGAFALLRALGDEAAAAPLCEEAATAYPAGDPSAVVAWATAGSLGIRRGDTAGAERALAALDEERRRLPAGGPVDAEPAEQRRWDAASRVLATQALTLASDVDAARGRYAPAAERLEELARRPETLARARPRLDAGDLLHRAADLRRRAGEKDRARADVTGALEAATTAFQVAHLTFWRLFLDHDALSKDGSLQVLTRWPGEAFERDLAAVLRGLSGNDHVGKFLLTVASSALVADRPDVAVELYDLAMRDRALLEQARTEKQVSHGLLPAFQAALSLRRYEEAERWLDDVERVGALPREEIDGLRLDLRNVRDAEAAGARREAEDRLAAEAEAARRAAGPDATDEPPRGTLAPREDEAGEAPPPGPVPDDGNDLALPGLLALAAVAALVLLLLRRGRI